MPALHCPTCSWRKRMNLAAYIVYRRRFTCLVGLMRQVKIELGINFGNFLPPVIAGLNATTACFTSFFVVFHQKWPDRTPPPGQLCRFDLFGAVPAVLCAVYHFTTPEVRYGDFDHNGVVECAEELLRVGSSRVTYT